MQEISPKLLQVLIVGALISLPFKIIGVWRSAKNDQKLWFGLMLLVNSLGFIELIYLFYFSDKKAKD